MSNETKSIGVLHPLKGWIKESETYWSYHGLGDWSDIYVIRQNNKWVAMQGDQNLYHKPRLYKTKNEAIKAAKDAVDVLDGLYELRI